VNDAVQQLPSLGVCELLTALAPGRGGVGEDPACRGYRGNCRPLRVDATVSFERPRQHNEFRMFE
jgi:hypothetical protein